MGEPAVRKIIATAAAVLLSSVVCYGSGQSHYTRDMYERAIAHDNPAVSGEVSFTPLYVLIRLKDRWSSKSRLVSTLSSSLSRAIETQYDIDALRGSRRVYEIAKSHFDAPFDFSNPKARRYVEPTYTPNIRNEVRRALAGKSPAELKKEVAQDNSSLTKLYRRDEGSRLIESDRYKDAVAHVLLENGILVGEAHGTTRLYVAP